MKRKLKIFVSCIAVIALFLTMMAYLGRLTQRKDSVEKYTDFFQQEADFDVLFLGSSHMLNAVYPMELWDDLGIVSYNMAGHANTIPVDYWMLQNALQYTTPKVVVIDAMGIAIDYKINPKFEYLHMNLDAFPLTKTKIQTVLDLVDDSKPGAGDKFSRQMEILWDFTTYHNRWSQLVKDDFAVNVSPEKGAEMRVGVAIPDEVPEVSPDSKYEGNALGLQYLERIILDCQDRGIQVLITYVPFPANELRIKEANALYDIAEKYGVKYINFLAEGTVDFDTDCYDANSHLNPSGAHKVTNYLGRVLREEYNVPDRREDPAYAQWHEDYEEYHAFKFNKMASQTSGNRYLMMLYDDDYSFVLELDRWGKTHSEQYRALLRNLGINPACVDEDVRYVVADRAAGTLELVSVSDLEAGPVETSLGVLTLQRDEENYQLLLNGEACITGDNRNASNYDYRVAVYSLAYERLDLKEMKLN